MASSRVDNHHMTTGELFQKFCFAKFANSHLQKTAAPHDDEKQDVA